MGRMYVPSTPATRGEVDPEVYDRQTSVEELRALADEQGFDLVAREDGDAGPGENPNAEPGPGQARAKWEVYARTVKGASDEDLVDEDGKPLKRDALVEKYGTPAE
jgi:hypothetical protein